MASVASNAGDATERKGGFPPRTGFKVRHGVDCELMVLKKQLLAHTKKAENAVAGYELLRSFFKQPMALDEDLQIALLIPSASS